jgi:hypothetical protein
MLTYTNYSEWSLDMRVNLQVVRLWEAIEHGTNDYREECTALAALLRAIPKEMQAGVAHKDSTSES